MSEDAAAQATEAVVISIDDGPRPLPKDAAVALFARWYDEHQGDEEATFTFRVSDGGRKMELLIGERSEWG